MILGIQLGIPRNNTILSGGGIDTPSIYTASGVSPTSFVANWSPVPSATSYALDVSTVSNFSTYFDGYAGLSVTTASKSVINLTSSVTYYYRVRAVGDGGISSGNSSVMTVSWSPALIAGSALLFDCQSALNTTVSGQYSQLTDLSGNNNHIIPPSQVARPGIQAGTLGIVLSGSHVLPLNSSVIPKTFVFAFKPISPSSQLSIVAYSTGSGGAYIIKERGTAGGGNGIAYQFGITQFVSVASSDVVTTGSKAIVSIRGQAAPNGLIRVNKVSKSLVTNSATVTNNLITHIFTHASATQYSSKGAMYGFYANLNFLTLEDIQTVQDWMSNRYSI